MREDGVPSRRFAGPRAAEQKQPCSLEQDGVSCSRDHIVIERACVAHGLIPFLGRDVGGYSCFHFHIATETQRREGNQAKPDSAPLCLCGS